MAGDPLVDGIIAGRLAALQGRGNYQLGQNIFAGLAFFVFKAAAFAMAIILCVIAPIPGFIIFLFVFISNYFIEKVILYLEPFSRGGESATMQIGFFVASILVLIFYIAIFFKLPSIILHFIRQEGKFFQNLRGGWSRIPKIFVGLIYSSASFIGTFLVSFYIMRDLFLSYEIGHYAILKSFEEFWEWMEVDILPEYGWSGLIDPVVMGSSILIGLSVCLGLAIISFSRAIWLVKDRPLPS